MTQLRIFTARTTVRVAAPPKRVFELFADVDRWPALFGPFVGVERLGFEGANERVRFQQRSAHGTRAWTVVHAIDPVRLRVRFRYVDPPGALTMLGGLCRVMPKSGDAVVAFDHYFRVAGNDTVTASRVERAIVVNSTRLLTTLQDIVESVFGTDILAAKRSRAS
jgi:aromatase